MKVGRMWSMPSRWTFDMPPAKTILNQQNVGKGWIDPFCGSSDICEFRNDIDENQMHATSHKLALDFLKGFETASIAGVIFDPPYSSYQMSECYKAAAKKVTMEMTQGWREEKNEIARVLKDGGICISFGWNSGGIGKNRGFEIIEFFLINHGGNRNDTIVTIDKKIQPMLNFDEVAK